MEKSAVHKMTYAEYCRIPTDGKRHEILEGEWYTTPAPNVPHQRCSRKLERILDEHVTRHALGEVFDAPIDVLLSDENVVQPDIVFVSSSRLAIVREENIQGPPDLVVEILSPSTAAIDRGKKHRLYEERGVREYWIVDPAARTCEIHEFAGPRRTRVYTDGQSFESSLLPGLTVALNDVL